MLLGGRGAEFAEGVATVLCRGGGRGSLSFAAPTLEFSAEASGEELVASFGLTEEMGRFHPSEFRFDLRVDIAR